MNSKLIPFILGVLFVCCVGADKTQWGVDPLPKSERVPVGVTNIVEWVHNAGAYQEPRKTLRDEFAMAAMNGLLSKGSYNTITGAKEQLAFLSYQMADAMMEARNKK